jgi:hypothetical protein
VDPGPCAKRVSRVVSLHVTSTHAKPSRLTDGLDWFAILEYEFCLGKSTALFCNVPVVPSSLYLYFGLTSDARLAHRSGLWNCRDCCKNGAFLEFGYIIKLLRVLHETSLLKRTISKA